MKNSQSQKLSANKNQHTQKNTQSQSQDNNIKDVVVSTKRDLEKKYSIKIKYRSEMPLSEMPLEKKVNILNSSGIRPDGGILSFELNGKECIILISEQKRQGTNDIRIFEGKDDQSHGNAVERLGKNVIAMDMIFGDEDIYPFVVFLQGCDFQEGESTIPDRVKTIFKFQPMNTINLYWTQIQKRLFAGGSYFMRGHSKFELVNADNENREPNLSDWSSEEMYNIMYEIADRSIQYYMSKY